MSGINEDLELRWTRRDGEYRAAHVGFVARVARSDTIEGCWLFWVHEEDGSWSALECKGLTRSLRQAKQICGHFMYFNQRLE